MVVHDAIFFPSLDSLVYMFWGSVIGRGVGWIGVVVWGGGGGALQKGKIMGPKCFASSSQPKQHSQMGPNLAHMEYCLGIQSKTFHDPPVPPPPPPPPAPTHFSRSMSKTSNSRIKPCYSSTPKPVRPPPPPLSMAKTLSIPISFCRGKTSLAPPPPPPLYRFV